VLPVDPLERVFNLTPSTPLCHMRTLAGTCIWGKIGSRINHPATGAGIGYDSEVAIHRN
jgi:hypothetical protein